MPVVGQACCKGALEAEAFHHRHSCEAWPGHGESCGTACPCSAQGSCRALPLPLACCHGEQILSCTLVGPMRLLSARVICCHCSHHNNQAFFFFFFNILFSVPHIAFSCLGAFLAPAAWCATARLNWKTKPRCALLRKLLSTTVYSARLLRIHAPVFHLLSLKRCRMNVFQMKRQATRKKGGKQVTRSKT